jgi:hypothetical protein
VELFWAEIVACDDAAVEAVRRHLVHSGIPEWRFETIDVPKVS